MLLVLSIKAKHLSACQQGLQEEYVIKWPVALGQYGGDLPSLEVTYNLDWAYSVT